MSTEIERWRQAVKNSSMAILKDVQKLLGFLKESSWSKLAAVSSEIAQHATDLMDTVTEGLSARSEASRKVLDTLKDIKASLVATMKDVESVASSTFDESLQDKLRNDCKNVAALIKLIHQQVADVTADDLSASEVQKSVASSIPAAPLARAEWLDKMHEQTKLATQALKSLQAAATNKDQNSLVSNAKNLSGHCAELLNQARKCKLDVQGDGVKGLVLNVINVAKTVFKSGDDTSIQQLQDAVASTDSGLQDLLHALENAAGITSTAVPPVASSSSSSPQLPESEPLSRSPPSSPRSAKRDKATSEPAESTPLPPASRSDDAADSKSQAPAPADVLSPKDASKQLQKEFSSRDPEKVFKVQELLGEGASGSVYRAIHRETKKVVAIKKMQVGVNNITSTVKEIKIMKDLKSPFTLKYYGCYQKDDCIWIIMEFCDGGSVQDIIDARESEPTCLSESQISQITYQVLKALEYLHSMKKIHRDIKAGNILINGRGMAKLADFGISAQQVGDEKRTTTIGSSYWMAPETLMGGGYDNKADIWSLGITVMEMAEGIPPLIEEQPHKAAFRIVNDPPPKLSKPDQWTPIFNDFLAKCLVKNPDKRPTAAELLSHPFIKQSEDENYSAILELLSWVDKHKKKRKKSSLKETILGSKQDVEEEANIDVYHTSDSISNEKVNLLVPAHATVEDVLRQCSEQFKLIKEAKLYSLYLVVEEAPGKQKEKQLGMFDLPVKIYTHASKKYKKKDKAARDPVRFIYK